MIEDSNNVLWYRAPAARALGQIAPGTPQADLAVSTLRGLLPEVQKRPGQDGNEEVIAALARFGPKAAAAAIPQLRELAKIANPTMSEAARKALSAIEDSP